MLWNRQMLFIQMFYHWTHKRPKVGLCLRLNSTEITIASSRNVRGLCIGFHFVSSLGKQWIIIYLTFFFLCVWFVIINRVSFKITVVASKVGWSIFYSASFSIAMILAPRLLVDFSRRISSSINNINKLTIFLHQLNRINKVTV